MGAQAQVGRPVGRVGCCWWTCGGRLWGEVARAWRPGHAGSWGGCGRRQLEMQGCWNLGIHWVETLCLRVTGEGQATSLNVLASRWGPGTDCKAHIISRHVVTYQAWFSLCLRRFFLWLRSGKLLFNHQSSSTFSPTSYLNIPANHSAKGTCPLSICPSHEPSTHWSRNLSNKGPASACTHSPPLRLSLRGCLV